MTATAPTRHPVLIQCHAVGRRGWSFIDAGLRLTMASTQMDKFAKINNVKLIQAVAQKPILWDNVLEMYHTDQYAKSVLWRDVTKEVVPDFMKMNAINKRSSSEDLILFLFVLYYLTAFIN